MENGRRRRGLREGNEGRRKNPVFTKKIDRKRRKIGQVWPPMLSLIPR